jgi:hypothetical protein
MAEDQEYQVPLLGGVRGGFELKIKDRSQQLIIKQLY